MFSKTAAMAAVFALGAATLVHASDTPVEVKVGDVPPDYVGTDFDDQPVKLSAFRGKVVVLTFWASWCAPCRTEMGVLDSVQKAAGDKDLQVVAVNDNEDEEVWTKFRRVLKPAMHLKVTHDVSKAVTRNFGIDRIPKMFLIDRTGHVAQVHQGYNEKHLDKLVDSINAVLAQK